MQPVNVPLLYWEGRNDLLRPPEYIFSGVGLGLVLGRKEGEYLGEIRKQERKVMYH